MSSDQGNRGDLGNWVGEKFRKYPIRSFISSAVLGFFAFWGGELIAQNAASFLFVGSDAAAWVSSVGQVIVALAGALVAIVLAQAAITLGNEANNMARISVRNESPQYNMAFNAYVQYKQLGVLVKSFDSAIERYDDDAPRFHELREAVRGVLMKPDLMVLVGSHEAALGRQEEGKRSAPKFATYAAKLLVVGENENNEFKESLRRVNEILKRTVTSFMESDIDKFEDGSIERYFREFVSKEILIETQSYTDMSELVEWIRKRIREAESGDNNEAALILKRGCSPTESQLLELLRTSSQELLSDLRNDDNFCEPVEEGINKNGAYFISLINEGRWLSKDDTPKGNEEFFAWKNDRLQYRYKLIRSLSNAASKYDIRGVIVVDDGGFLGRSIGSNGDGYDEFYNDLLEDVRSYGLKDAMDLPRYKDVDKFKDIKDKMLWLSVLREGWEEKKKDEWGLAECIANRPRVKDNLFVANVKMWSHDKSDEHVIVPG